MPRQRHEARLEWPIRTIFASLVGVLAKGRWAKDFVLEPSSPFPRPGQCYEQQRPTVLRRGRVVECIPPVSITLAETLFDPPCRVQLRLRCRIEPMELVSLLRLDASFDLEGAASLRRRHWNDRIHAYCTRLLSGIESALESLEVAPGRNEAADGAGRLAAPAAESADSRERLPRPAASSEG
ncbi:MAG TPA: hypothetical protein VFV10_03130 [Gammaproteobacteria bacterium]|nr:hypothetical protein [Gammaproteobacteria bacterium]